MQKLEGSVGLGRNRLFDSGLGIGGLHGGLGNCRTRCVSHCSADLSGCFLRLNSGIETGQSECD